MIQKETRQNCENYRISRMEANRLCRRKKREAMKQRVENLRTFMNLKDFEAFLKKLKLRQL